MKFLYGILFWDEIYYPKVPYVFQTANQFGPLDFYDGDFYYHRKDIIDAKLSRLEAMSREDIKAMFLELYEKHKHKHNLLVNWDHQKLTAPRLATILYCCGPKLVCMFFRYLA